MRACTHKIVPEIRKQAPCLSEAARAHPDVALYPAKNPRKYASLAGALVVWFLYR